MAECEEPTRLCWKGLCGKGFLLCLELVLFIVLFAVALAGVLLWRLSASPIDLSVLKPRIAAALHAHVGEEGLQFDQAILHWPDLRGPLLIGLRGVDVNVPAKGLSVNVVEIGLGLSYRSLLSRQITPRYIALQSPDVRYVAPEDSAYVERSRGAIDLRAIIASTINDFAPDLEVLMLNNGRGAYADAALGVNVIVEDVQARIDVNSAHEIGAKVKIAALYAAGSEAESSMEDMQLNLSIDSQKSDHTITAHMYVPKILPTAFAALWPESAHDVGAFKWLTSRLHSGVYSDVKVNVSADSAASLSGLTVDFGFDGMGVNYRDPLPPVEMAKGGGRFDYIAEMLQVNVEEAIAGGLRISDSKIELAHIIESKKGMADVHVQLSGALSDMLAFLEHEPLKLQHGFDLEKVKGDGKVAVNLVLPTFGRVTMNDIELKVRGDLTQATLPALIQSHAMGEADASLVIEDNIIDIAGQGSVLGDMLGFEYRDFVSSVGRPFNYRAQFSGRISDSTLVALGADLDLFLLGGSDIKGDYIAQNNGDATLELAADLTQSRVFFDALSYNKPIGHAADAAMVVQFKGGNIERIENLNIKGLGLMLQDAQIDFAQRNGREVLSALTIPEAKIGRSDGKVAIEFMPDNRLNIRADMQQFDLQAITSAAKGERPGDRVPILVNFTAQDMLVKDDRGLSDVQIFAVLSADGRFDQLELDARAGTGDVYLRYKPDQAGVRAFRFEADDAGATLYSLGAYDDIVGGKILIDGRPADGFDEKKLGGIAEMTNFEVRNAPILARLLSLMSLDGLAKGAVSDGIQFTRLESRFDWLYRPEGSLLTVADGRTSGTAVGLTFDGTFDQATEELDLKGTIIPVSEVNKIIKSIPVLGEILTGGSGVIAATYTVEGSAEDPDLSMNPLSVLAPGFLRKILFE